MSVASSSSVLELVSCPYCRGGTYSPWATEIGFSAVRCSGCALIYVNPRPTMSLISAAVQSGAHGDEAGRLNVVSRHDPRKVSRYRRVFSHLFDDLWRGNRTVYWLDVGAGYGEVVEAISCLLSPGSRVEGIEPMAPKAAHARARGLAITEGYLQRSHEKVDIVSVVDVFSHIPDFGQFLEDVKAILHPRGEMFIETGNLADLTHRADFPGELGLPDHLVFAGERQLRGYLEKANFEIVSVERERIDGPSNLIKNIVKKLIGRPVTLSLPYTSKYRQLLIRARLRLE